MSRKDAEDAKIIRSIFLQFFFVFSASFECTYICIDINELYAKLQI